MKERRADHWVQITDLRKIVLIKKEKMPWIFFFCE